MLRNIGVGRLRLLVARAFRNFLPIPVDDETVREDGLVGRRVKGDHARPEGRLEPPAMLVAAFEIKIRRPLRTALMALEHGGVGRTRVDPHVQRVTTAGESGGRGPNGWELDALQDLRRRGL